ncbi:zinc-dependent alcohol dehydrogenase [Solicola sp. PLA-1-18]|uniref:zinc-dependent alcohol dehydrogenase n=1 Tax=Solicola sp. PLA-1-18 TaxID=3380532 RepID=UPI003B7A3B84
MTSTPDVAGRRRVRVQAPGEIEVVDEALPDLAPDEALVATSVVGLCGSDTHAAHGRHPFVALPYYPGHEVVGVVEALGDAAEAVEGVAVGSRVTVEPTLPCGTCKSCTTGRENICENLQFFGCGFREGGMADRFTVRASRLRPIPDDLDDLQAVLVEPLSTPVHAVRLAGDVTGRSVVVLGAGTIGLLVGAAARHRGARTVVMTDVREDKRERALRLGADHVVDAAADDVVEQVRSVLGESADVVFDCVAVQPTVEAAIAMALKGGTVVVVGVPTGDVRVPLAIVQDQQVRIQGAATYLREDYEESMEILRAGSVRTDDMITSRLPLADAAEAFVTASAGDQVKVVLVP